MTGPGDASGAPGAHLAVGVIQPSSPVLRIRYRHGVLMTPAGFPDWALCARAVVALPPAAPDLTVDEVRVVDVLAANLAMARAADRDPLWTPAVSTVDSVVATPAGWCWAHLGPSRHLALVPAELHSSFRHAGGVRLFGFRGRGLRVDAVADPVGPGSGDAMPDDVLELLERLLGSALPAGYRRFLSDTNGAGPAAPGVLAGFGFVADQPFFGVARADPFQDLSYVDEWMRDRLTREFLPIGHVQGGLLAVKLRGDDADSIWYWDDDDPRDLERFTAEEICANLLHRCADGIDAFWQALARPAHDLARLAVQWVDAGGVTTIRDGSTGAGLPATMKAPWQTKPARRADPLITMVEVRAR